jgi:RTX calcium-binding nonapeptide repeat (4 copies)
MRDGLRGPRSGPPTAPGLPRAHTVLLACALALAALTAALVPAGANAVPTAAEAALLRDDDRGLYVHYCPSGERVAAIAPLRARMAQARAPLATIAMADHAGWPSDECLKMDKSGPGLSHTLVGLAHVHNWLLGGYGNDTFYGGENGDVIWGDYHPEGQPESERDYIHAGNGEDWIYSSHGFNEIWTGGGDDHLALVYGHGVVHCDGRGVKTFVMRYLPQNRPWKLLGCGHKVIDPYRV